MSAITWSTIANLATALGTILPIKNPSASPEASSSASPDASSSASPEASPSVSPDARPDRTPEPGWLATASRHWNIDRPDPR